MNNEKPRSDPSEYFNFGLDEEKWIKFVNKSILMHYEKHLIQSKLKGDDKKQNSHNNQIHYEQQPFPRGYMNQDFRMMAMHYNPGMFPQPGFYDTKNNK